MPIHSETPSITTNVERDPRLFMWFLTLVMVVMYSITLVEKPELRQSWQVIVFTVLMVVHIILHWQIEKVILTPRLTVVYIIVQGVLGFAICWVAGYEGIIFAIFMALLGETVGMLGLSRATLVTSLYYLTLAYINLRQIMNVGSSGWMLIGIIPVMIFVVTYVTLYRRQTDAREQAQTLANELEKANQQLSQYAAQLEDLTITNERQRMARELHDTLSQGLTGIILQLEAVEAHLDNGSVEKARAIISHSMGQARSTLADARSAIDDLRGSQFDNLESALRQEVFRFQNATDITCDLVLNELPALQQHVVDVIVHNVAEGLTNIGRHAQAQKVKVAVELDGEVLTVILQDDGQGFDPVGVPSGHYGLLGIRERMRLSNGKLDIYSKLGEGTRLEMRFPL